MLLSVLLSVVLLCFSSYSSAQQATIPSGSSSNVLVIGNGWQGTFSNCTYGVDCWAGSSDQGDVHSGDDWTFPTGQRGTYYWSGTEQTITNTIAISQALQAAGIQVDGYSYKWIFKNGNANWFSGQGRVDPLEVVVNVYDSNGNLYKSYTYDYGTQFSNWKTHTGTELFGALGLDPTWFGNLEVLITAKDIEGWAGYYGPEFRWEQSELVLNYSQNLCYNNPLYDPQCPGYAAAYAQQLYNQQCAANPLFDSGCPGYANAYYNQQCAINPLYDSGCSGYQTAYLNQQCSLDPLYDPQCTGYDDAYLLQQCDLDPLYDVTCIGYQQAYVEKQCETDPLYDITCVGYNDAIALQDTTDVIDDGVTDTEIDVVTTTIIEGIPNVMTLPEVPPVQVVELDNESGFQEVEDTISGDQMNMEDDIEKEIAELERAENEEIVEEEEVVVVTEDGSEEELPGNADGSMGKGEATQEDDIEKELAELKKEEKEESPKKTSRNDKMKLLLAKKAIELTKRVEESVSIEQQMIVQRQLLALISYVPGFDYAEKKLNQVNFYPDKPTVDHAYARWFLNDPNFVEMEDLQYNFK